MPKKRILISVTTYPLPSRSYDELVCTAGFLEDGTWIRICLLYTSIADSEPNKLYKIDKVPPTNSPLAVPR